MDPAGAAQAAALLSAGTAIPIHWGTYFPARHAAGLARCSTILTDPPREFARRAADIAPDTDVLVLEPGDGVRTCGNDVPAGAQGPCQGSVQRPDVDRGWHWPTYLISCLVLWIALIPAKLVITSWIGVPIAAALVLVVGWALRPSLIGLAMMFGWLGAILLALFFNACVMYVA